MYAIGMLIINYQLILVKKKQFFSAGNLPELNITYSYKRIKQYRLVEYLSCCQR